MTVNGFNEEEVFDLLQLVSDHLYESSPIEVETEFKDQHPEFNWDSPCFVAAIVSAIKEKDDAVITIEQILKFMKAHEIGIFEEKDPLDCP